jgi:CyaY protein
MNETEFHRLADATLNALFATMEEADNSGALEVEYLEGIMTLEFDSGKQIIISKHMPSRQIWVSSPLSGGLHFSYHPQQQDWRTASGQELLPLLSQDIEKLSGVKVA